MHRFLLIPGFMVLALLPTTAKPADIASCGGCQTLTASRVAGASVKLSGSLGVFFPGSLVARVYDRAGRFLRKARLSSVDPGEAVTVNQEIDAGGAPGRVSLHLEDSDGVDRGSLGEANVEPAPGDDRR